MKKKINHAASFKDPAARVYFTEGEEKYIYRDLSPDYLPHFNHLETSGLAEALQKKNYILPYRKVDAEGIVTLESEFISFSPYPYEWTFHQWKEAALLTLKIQYLALNHGMILKDASPFNIIFRGCQPLFIDHSSFEIYKGESGWIAYKQFSETFYIMLLLLKYYDKAANEMFTFHMNGLPLYSTLKMLPLSARLNLKNIFYLSLPAKINAAAKPRNQTVPTKKSNPVKALQLAEQLHRNIKAIHPNKKLTRWNHYYQDNVADNYGKEKETVIQQWFGENYNSKTCIDFGCNAGHYSLLLSSSFRHIIAFDEDLPSVDSLYQQTRKEKIINITCFTAGITQPTPATGWENKERLSLTDRLHADVGIALALVHHLAITAYISFPMMAEYFARACNELVVEFVPKTDEKVTRLLQERKDIFTAYTRENFLEAFGQKFSLLKQHNFENGRILFHFTCK
ncbi:MAG: hypothetical protein ABIT96_13150 [Ferruginibacter sp.]